LISYVGKTLVQLAVLIVGILTIVFFLIRLIPGDPAAAMLGDYATPQAIADLHVQLGLDQPLMVQYGRFVVRALHGDFGDSVVSGQPALDEVLDSLPDSAALAATGLVIAIAIGVPLGIVAARRAGGLVDVLTMVAGLLGISFPVFWLGLVAVLLLAHKVRIFPALGAASTDALSDQLIHLALPALVLGVSTAAYIARLTRSAMLEALSQEHIRVARALGVGERRIVYRLALRNALIPILAIIGVTFALSLGSAILVEAVFSRPGLGTTIMKAILARDYQLVQAGVLVLALAVIAVNTVIDLAYLAVATSAAGPNA
jgi:peptide/nickel transport system permease protein